MTGRQPVVAAHGYKPVDGCPLTERQLQVVNGLSQGLSRSQIARRLYLSDGTVQTHLGRIYRTLGTTSQAGAVAIVLRRGWLK